jgi:hypothetical protein
VRGVFGRVVREFHDASYLTDAVGCSEVWIMRLPLYHFLCAAHAQHTPIKGLRGPVWAEGAASLPSAGVLS